MSFTENMVIYRHLWKKREFNLRQPQLKDLCFCPWLCLNFTSPNIISSSKFMSYDVHEGFPNPTSSGLYLLCELPWRTDFISLVSSICALTPSQSPKKRDMPLLTGFYLCTYCSLNARSRFTPDMAHSTQHSTLHTVYTQSIKAELSWIKIKAYFNENASYKGIHCFINKLLSLKYHLAAAAAAESLQSCPTLCDPIDGSPPGSPVPGILQARTLEWASISFSKISS